MMRMTRSPGLLKWTLILISLIVPTIPAKLFFSLFFSSRRLWLFLVLWAMLGAANIFVIWRNSRQLNKPNSDLVYISYIILCFIPFLLSGIWLFSGPYFEFASLFIFAASSLIPLLFNFVWGIFARNFRSELNWTNIFLLPFISSLVSFVILEVASENLLAINPFNENITINSSDRAYWYIIHRTGPDGVNIANSFGFLGPEPEVNYSGIRVLLIGDSIPAADRSVNFPKVAQAIYEEQGFKGQIEIVNASISGYSLEQINRYYSEKLKDLQHDILILSFYIDDINRELRYRKKNYMYTPSWPEWMQDVYYRCFFCKLFLNMNGFTDNTFLLYRTHSYEYSFSSALKVLDEIRGTAEKYGARFALFNIPKFAWEDVLTEISGYKFLEMNKKVEEWCREKGIPYYDVLPTLIGKDIRRFRMSNENLHFNDLGHQLVGVELKNFLNILIASEGLKPNKANAAYP